MERMAESGWVRWKTTVRSSGASMLSMVSQMKEGLSCRFLQRLMENMTSAEVTGLPLAKVASRSFTVRVRPSSENS